MFSHYSLSKRTLCISLKQTQVRNAFQSSHPRNAPKKYTPRIENQTHLPELSKDPSEKSREDSFEKVFSNLIPPAPLLNPPTLEPSKNEFALAYNPDFWNQNQDILYTTNCYAYALNLYQLPFFMSPSSFSLQPGSISNLSLNLVLLDVRQIIQNCIADAKKMDGLFIEANEHTPCPTGAWKIALFYSPHGDYHWYREDKEGTWSHKLGKMKVSNLDSQQRLITNPITCAKRYATIEYSEFGGYFYVKPGSFEAMLSSRVYA